MSLTARQQVLRSYRRVLKAALVTFQNDAPRVADSFAAARRVYLQFSNLTDDAEIRRRAAVRNALPPVCVSVWLLFEWIFLFVCVL